MADELRLDDQVAVVTGAGRGIGRAHALLLAARGARVVVNDLGVTKEGASGSLGPATEVVEEIRTNGGEAVANFSDVSTPAGGESLVADAVKNFGRIDIVVANAGLWTRPRPFIETTFELFERQWRVHLGGCYNVTRAAWPYLVNQGYGRVVLTGSSAGFYGMPMCVEYSSAKGAISGLLTGLSHEAAGHGICVNGLGPAGYTRMVEGLFPDDATDRAVARYFRSELSSPLVAWLAHKSCDVNGHFYQCHGGRVARVNIGEPDGYWDLELTPESLISGLDRAQDVSDLKYPPDAGTWAGWVADRAADHDHAAESVR